MSKTKLPYRFVYDSHHFHALKDILDQTRFSVYLLRLMKISSNSIDHKRKHCLISQKSMDGISKNTLKFEGIGQTLFSKALEPQDIDAIEKVEDEIERTIRYAQDAKTYEPFVSAIFTSDDKLPDYQGVLDSVGKNAENIILFGHTEAEKLIKTFHDVVEANLSGSSNSS